MPRSRGRDGHRPTAETLFDLELDVDAHRLYFAAATGETATTSSGRPQLGLGDEVTFRARHLGLPWCMTCRVTTYERPSRFVDEQVRGPFLAFRHEHGFEPVDKRTTRMTDVMTFSAPYGRVGAMVARWAIAPYLRRLLRVRARYMKHVAESHRQAAPALSRPPPPTSACGGGRGSAC